MCLPTDALPSPIKIGFSSNVLNRLNGMQISSPFPLELLAYWPAGDHSGMEPAIHSLLEPHRIRGEWFEPAPEVIGLISRQFALYKDAYRQVIREWGLEGQLELEDLTPDLQDRASNRAYQLFLETTALVARPGVLPKS